jgi:polyhydroxyalkanoate synthesis repressor PhaR
VQRERVSATLAAVATLVIKKYGNRRLYDTSESKYIVMDELAAYIRGGVDVRVVDASTNEDLTQATLTQILLETGGGKHLPAPLLMQLIRLGDDAMADFFNRYVTAALEMYLQARRGLQAITQFAPLGQLPWLPPNPTPSYAPPYTGYAPPSPYVAPPPPPDEPAPAASSDDVRSLRRELDELKQAIREGLSQRAPRKKKKP